MRSLVFDTLKVVQAALICLHGVQFSCPHACSYLCKPVCAGKPAVKFTRVAGPLVCMLSVCGLIVMSLSNELWSICVRGLV